MIAQRRIAPGLLLTALAMATTASAQAASPVQAELRADVTAGDVTIAQLGAGLYVRSGTYLRIAALGGVGGAWDGTERGTSARLEVQGRFHLDPFREARVGAYGLGGVAANHDPFAEWQARLVVGAGLELPARGRTVLAVEVALAGGLRFSVVARRTELHRR